MKAVILAAGEGKRLRPFTEAMPKVMLPVANKPILEYVVDAVKNNGIEEIILVVGYKKEAIMDHFKDFQDVKIRYVIQEKQLGTAHALLQAKDMIDDAFLVLPGDNIIDAKGLTKLVQEKVSYALLIKEHPHPSKYGMVTIKSNILEQIIEKPQQEESHLISTGIYKFPSSIFEEIESHTSKGDHALSSVVQSLVEQKKEIHTIPTDLWHDVVYPWDLLEVNDIILRNNPSKKSGTIENNVMIKGNVCIGEDTVIHAGCYILGPVTIGKNCEIGPNVCIFPSTTIGDNTSIQSFTEIHNSLIMDDIKIGSSSYISHSIVGTGTVLHHGLSTLIGSLIRHHDHDCITVDDIGVMIAEDTTIQSHVVTDPGIIIGRHCTISPMKHIKEDILSETRVM
jgi:UDP-N-acetylglucosamine diphosphorylase / glucose-1-phosphate thymidylyltransferase / UDP-N-acetylgalactosamine diphosphorylase / glucosamine-1-phosphate N-acetyltransferase / galactosamine-1-phosphate N-acetyltransferase